jgi:dihydrofolate reductase
MRKLKLQVFMSVDGYIAGLDSEEPDDSATPEKPPTSETDEKMEQYINSTLDTSDTILLGRKMNLSLIGKTWSTISPKALNSSLPGSWWIPQKLYLAKH